VDANFIRDEVTGRKEKLEAFIENILKTDFPLNENILSKEEYENAMAGKKHFADDAFRFNAMRARNSRLMAIFFSDVVGYSAMMGKDEKKGLNILDDNRRIHLENIEKLNGTLLKEIGDGTLAGFNSVLDAVNCGIEIQKQVKAAGHYQLRIGIHLGEVITEHHDVFGDGVNIASRIESVAQPGTVSMSEAVYNNIKNKIEEEIVPSGEKHLKNISEPVKIFQVNVPVEIRN
jgi:class 3 adenylate cyclase